MIFFLFLIEIICYDPSSEPSHQDGSDEGVTRYVFMQNEQKLSLIISK